MPTDPPTRSVKISEDERRGWSSDRPRRDGAPPRPPSLSVRSRVLSPSDHVRYSPGSLLVIVSPSSAERDRFTQVVDAARSELILGLSAQQAAPPRHAALRREESRRSRAQGAHPAQSYGVILRGTTV